VRKRAPCGTTIVWSTVIAAVIALLASPAGATPILGADLPGGLISPIASMTRDLLGANEPCCGAVHGTLTTDVYETGGLYTYVATVTPASSSNPSYPQGITGISLFATTFVPAGLTGYAGWSWTDAEAAGASSVGFSGSSVFSLALTPGGLTWQVDPLANADCPPACFWNHQESIRFYYQSTLGPGGVAVAYSTGVYSTQNATQGSGVGLAPVASVPEPATLLLLGSGVAGAGLWTRRRRNRA
jgi:hypothetical protein